MLRLCIFILLVLTSSTTNAGSEEDPTSASAVFYEEFYETTTSEYPGTTSAQQDYTGSTSTSTSRLSPSQTAVLRELKEIWDYSLGLNETTDAELKMTLSSVVQLAYARLHAEPDDTLHRLKYLLEKLRQRIGVSHRQTVIRIKDQDVDSSTAAAAATATKKVEKIMSRNQHRNKRGAEADGIGEVERIEPTADHDYYYDNSIYSNSLSYVKNRPISYEVDTTATSLPTSTFPNEKTIHKVLHIQDESHHLPSKVIGWKKKPSAATTTTKPNLLDVSKPTIFYPPINLADSEGYSSENEIPPPADQHNKDEPSLEHIANAIVQLLYPLQSPTAFPPQRHPPQEFQFPHHKHLFQHKLDSINNKLEQTESTTAEIDLTSTDVNAPASSEDINVTTQIPPHFKVFTSNQTIKTAEDKFGLKVGAAQANSPASSTTTKKPGPRPQVFQVIHELEANNLFKAPAAFINGTREGFLTFVATLSTLSFTTKMVIIFALSISILSILLGVYSLGPPIIAVGILGIMIPICILLLLNDGKSSSNNVNRIGSPQSKINWNDQVSFVLDLLDEALEKYGEMDKS